ncbi:MBOAT family O-acyltransferase [Candidatus Hydrogenedentota bacterium]
MIFNSVEFLVFLVVVLSLYYILNHRWQNILLLVASYFFYGWWDWRFLSLLGISTVVDYACGWGVYLSENRHRKKLFVLLSVCCNLGILGFFKYFNFFAASTTRLFSALGMDASPTTLNIVLPVGISFYTFQTMCYTIEIYRKELKPSRDFISYALYVSFFPQLVAGPIERAKNLLPRLSRRRVVTFADLSIGFRLIISGFVKKVAIADVVARSVNLAFDDPAAHSGVTLIVAVYLFAIQIYCDFSGYSDIARGTARLLGVDIMQNFRFPYLSTSLRDFWRRWHISLSSWFRDYLYIPLGGSHGGLAKTMRNLMITMTLCGLWHGAAWNFVWWGSLHAGFLCCERVYATIKPQRNKEREGRLAAFLGWFITFHFVGLGWILFRSTSLGHAFTYLNSMCQGGLSVDKGSLYSLLWALALLLWIEIPYVPAIKKRVSRFTPMIHAVGLLVIIITWTSDYVPFIYFQF